MAAKQPTPQQAAMFHQSQGFTGCFGGCCLHEAIDRAEEAEKELAVVKGQLLAYTQREAGYELCEAHPDHWHPIEEMFLTEDGCWLCLRAWEELKQEGGVPA